MLRRRARVSPDLIITLAALTISVISLGASVRFGRQGQEHSRKSVLPILYVGRCYHLRLVEVRICNHATGTLIVQTLKPSHSARVEWRLMQIIPKAPEDFALAAHGNLEGRRTFPLQGHAFVTAAGLVPQR